MKVLFVDKQETCSELSSGIYCRVKWLSTDVSEVRTASIIRDPRRQLWTSYSPPWELEISQTRNSFLNTLYLFNGVLTDLKIAILNLPFMYTLRCAHHKTWHQSSYKLSLSLRSLTIKVMCPALHDSVAQAVMVGGLPRRRDSSARHASIGLPVLPVTPLPTFISLSLCYLPLTSSPNAL
jgi:hypothetical protein